MSANASMMRAEYWERTLLHKVPVEEVRADETGRKAPKRTVPNYATRSIKEIDRPILSDFYKCAQRRHWGSEHFRLSLIGYLVVNERASMYIYVQVQAAKDARPNPKKKAKKIISCA